jgi:N-acetylglucosamine kinase-like BadF-type ATPase
MKLIADSGSTKTHWSIIESRKLLKEIFTNGINPFYQNTSEIAAELNAGLLAQIAKPEKISEIHFYGAGCSFPEKKKTVSDALKSFFAEAIIEVESDLLGAARALLGHEKGIACILGTGSNSCYYNGEEIEQNVSPLGFILGDEGSGAVLGKLLVGDCLKNQIPENLKAAFFNKYNFTAAEILENVYRKPFPNRFLAQFTPFLAEHIEEPYVFNLVYDAFDSFITRNVLQYPLDDIKVGFIGSIAWYFKDTLEIVCSERNLLMAGITKNPMEGLVHFHL